MHQICQTNFIMENRDKDRQRLKEKVETVVGKKIETPRDFNFLSKQVEGFTGESLSASTLKRVWGYVDSASKQSKYTLDTLAQMVGYASWDNFVKGGMEDSFVSFRIISRKLVSDALVFGDLVKLVWKPDRVVTVEYQGQSTFRVVESVNSKLSVGDTFQCSQFVDKQELYLNNLIHPGMPVTDYVCGQQGGIVWSLVSKD